MDYQQSMKNNFIVLARLERAEMGRVTVSSLGTLSGVSGRTMESGFSLAGIKGAVAAHFLVPTGPWVSFLEKFIP